MKYRKLRIAWSVAWGVVAVLLVVLWVRSYWWIDGIYIAHTHCGILERGLLHIDAGVSSSAAFTQYSYEPYFLYSVWRQQSGVAVNAQPLAVVSVWIPTLLLCVSAVLPWIRWRFSLRTLLFATTLIAVGLGLIVWAIR
jgi:hypothetical protein